MDVAECEKIVLLHPKTMKKGGCTEASFTTQGLVIINSRVSKQSLAFLALTPTLYLLKDQVVK